MDAVVGSKQLLEVVENAKTCYTCLLHGSKCVYMKLDAQCSECLSWGCECISFATISVLWDMGSSHKRTKLVTATSSDLHSKSADEDFLSPVKFCICFGGLHLAKACTNAMRNHIMTHNGMNYGMNVFRAIKKISETLQSIKQAVFMAKDRQSDLLSYLTSCPLVQQGLQEMEKYAVQRVPEPFLDYTKNAKTHKDIGKPISLTSNHNGDIFILDAMNACVHVIDRSVVSKVFLIGKYNSPSTAYYKDSEVVKGSNAKFSNEILDIASSDKDDIFVLDGGRKEVVVVRNVSVAKLVGTKNVQVMSLEGSSIAPVSKRRLLVLSRNKDTVNIIKPMFPKCYELHVNHQTLFSIKAPSLLKQVFCVNNMENAFGVVDVHCHVHLYFIQGKKLHKQQSLGVVSDCKPCINDGHFTWLQSNEIHSASLVVESSGEDTGIQLRNVVKRAVTSSIRLFHCWGNITYTVNQMSVAKHDLKEMGSLDFGVEWCKALSSFYDAISYRRPGFGTPIGEPDQVITLRDAIAKATPLSTC